MLRLFFIIGMILLVLSAGAITLTPRFVAVPEFAELRDSIEGWRIAAPTATPAATPLPKPTLTPSELPAPTPACGPPAGWGTYIIQAGDTLSDLALRSGTTVEAIQAANCLGSDLIFADQPLLLPRAPDPRPLPPPQASTAISAPQIDRTATALAMPTMLSTTAAVPTSSPIAVPTAPNQTPALATAALPTTTPTKTIIAILPPLLTTTIPGPSQPTPTLLQTGAGPTPTSPIVFIPATITPELPATSPAVSPILTNISAPASATLAPTPAPPAMIAARYPAKLNVDTNAFFVVMLIQNGKPVPTPQLRGQKTAVAPIPPVGTPQIPLQKQFGSSYTGYVRARLIAPGFEAIPTGELVSLEQPEITWRWELVPKSAGTKTITVVVNGEWQPVKGGATITRELWSHEIRIVVHQPWITLGQVDVSSLFCSILGSSLSLPWLIANTRHLLNQYLTKPKPGGTSS